MSTAPQPRLTYEEYDQLEKTTGLKYEYHNGEVFAMGGASRTHARITTNLPRSVGFRLIGKPCEDFGSDLRVAIPGSGRYMYPDYSIACGPLRAEQPDREAFTNPKVIFEVLSPSTENYDRGAKFDLYSRIPSLEEYILIAQDRYAIDRFKRLENSSSWTLTRYRGVDAVLELESLAIAVPLSEIYDAVDFTFAEHSFEPLPIL